MGWVQPGLLGSRGLRSWAVLSRAVGWVRARRLGWVAGFGLRTSGLGLRAAGYGSRSLDRWALLWARQAVGWLAGLDLPWAAGCVWAVCCRGLGHGLPRGLRARAELDVGGAEILGLGKEPRFDGWVWSRLTRRDSVR